MSEVLIDIEKLARNFKKYINVEILVKERVQEEKDRAINDFLAQRFVKADLESGIMFDDVELKDFLNEFIEFLEKP